MFLAPVLTLACRISEHLDTIGGPIDYHRRRDHLPARLIGWDQWRELALAAGEHPGDGPEHGRHLHAQRYLHQLLSGADLSDPRHELALRSPVGRAVYIKFLTALTAPLRAALHAHAASVLAELGIDEPLTWSPPAELAEGLVLPGIENLDIPAIRSLVIDQGAAPREVAQLLGVHVEHIRIALESLGRPPRRWKKSAAPLVWRREQHAAHQLTAAFFHREHLAGRGRLDDLAATTGLERHTITRYAKKAGIKLGPRPIPIDPHWLRSQYHQQQRPVTDIAAQLGVSQSTISLALRRHQIPARPRSVRSRPEMITPLAREIPPDIRAAVEGGLDGWQRLRRFKIAVTFPTLHAAADHLATSPTVLVNQLKRLEHDIDARLIHRATPGKPQRPTERGQNLLRDLDHDSVRTFMTEPDDTRAATAAIKTHKRSAPAIRHPHRRAPAPQKAKNG